MSEKNRYQDPVQEAHPKVKARVNRVIEHMIAIPPSRMDPNGSYTGKPMTAGDVPMQDADDL